MCKTFLKERCEPTNRMKNEKRKQKMSSTTAICSAPQDNFKSHFATKKKNAKNSVSIHFAFFFENNFLLCEFSSIDIFACVNKWINWKTIHTSDEWMTMCLKKCSRKWTNKEIITENKMLRICKRMKYIFQATNYQSANREW